jgi:hypothetical protein
MLTMSQYSMRIANPWKDEERILTRLFQERVAAKKEKKNRPIPNLQPKSGERFWRQEKSSAEQSKWVSKRPGPQRRVLYPIN